MASPIVNTNYGPVKGLQKTSCYNKQYNAFYAIPYAEKVVDEYRFKAPRPLQKWENVLDATKVGDSCWLFDKLNPYEKKIIGSENCLHLNIYTPELNPTKKLPLMVYFHGGRYTTMSGSPFYYGPDYLMEKNVILITFNFRMGVFGFLSLKDETLGIPGNAGMKDQVMALKWIKENVECFGGDSENITIFGQSSGATSVHYHLLSDASKGLFNRAIIMSGSAFVPWALIPPKDFAYRLVKALGYEGKENDADILEYLKTLKPEDLVSTQETIFTPNERATGQLIAFGPVIEPYMTENTFMSAHPFEMAENAWGNDVDVMIGGCSHEGLLLYARFNPIMLKSLGNFSSIVSLNVQLEPDDPKCGEKGLQIKRFYYGDSEPNEENIGTFFTMQGHKVFWHGMWLTIKSRVKNVNSNTFLYRFALEPTTNKTIRQAFGVPHMRGASHVEDVFYIFKAEYLEPHVKGTHEYEVMQVMTETFTSFARTGNPNVHRLGDVKWNPIKSFEDKHQIKCLNISNDFSFIELPETKYMEIWDEICDNVKF
uniref:Carboxylic ester hydrolase n=1 Tax=Culicoides sonorensis TaxID=179676 RepID=A0A336M0Z5_CULSO